MTSTSTNVSNGDQYSKLIELNKLLDIRPVAIHPNFFIEWVRSSSNRKNLLTEIGWITM